MEQPEDNRDEPEVQVERRGQVAIVTMNRAKRSNPIGWTLGRNLVAAFDELEADESVGAIVLTGAGKNFCAGGAMGETLGIHEIDAEKQYAAFRNIARAVSRIRNLDLPVIAAVNGAAVGGGAAIALACDLCITSDKSFFGFGFGQLGATAADLGIPYTLPRLVGLARARQILFTGATVTAAQAKEYGMVLEVVPDRELVNEAIALAQQIASTPRPATAATKHVLKHAETAEYESCLYTDQFVQTFFLRGDEHKRRLTELLSAGRRK